MIKYRHKGSKIKKSKISLGPNSAILFSTRHDSMTYKVFKKVGLHTTHLFGTFLDLNHRGMNVNHMLIYQNVTVKISHHTFIAILESLKNYRIKKLNLPNNSGNHF